jgi:outer membrane receptor protein involved in Fe transport
MQLDNRRLTLNGAVFQIDWNNLQSQVFLQGLDPARQCTSDQIVNVGDARIRGLEIEGNLKIVPGLTLDAAFAYNDPKYKDNIPALNIRSGQTIEGTPKMTFYLAMRYGFNVGGRDAFFRTDWSYTGEIAKRGLDFRTQAQPFQTGDFSEFNARLGVEVVDNVNLDVFVTNIFDTFGVTRQTDIGGGAPPTVFTIRPRTAGATLRANF